MFIANRVFSRYLAERIRLFKEHRKEWEDKTVSPVSSTKFI
jgi:hypothetical protein